MFSRSPMQRKSATEINRQREEEGLVKTLSLFDLVMIGVGGTVGSGIFVLSAQIEAEVTGPQILVAWFVGAFVCVLSGFSFAELSSRVPVTGSSYAYAFYALGELPASLAGWFISMEYGVSASGVARSWGDKVVAYAEQNRLLRLGRNASEIIGEDGDNSPYRWLNDAWYEARGEGFNLLGGLLIIACVVVTLLGIEVGKRAINVLSVAKIALVIFIISAGFTSFDRDNYEPFVPPEYGTAGIFRGATLLFFAYIGFDEACCLSGECVDPKRTMAPAVVGTIVIVTTLYVASSAALVGMLPYNTPGLADGGFAGAFLAVDQKFAFHIVAVGEIVLLPVVVLICFMCQPRLQLAMARDGMIPKVFGRLDDQGRPQKGTLITGVACAAVAFSVPFAYINDLISAAVLAAFSITNASAIMVRHRHGKPKYAPRLLLAYACAASSGGLCIGIGALHDESGAGATVATTVGVALSVVALLLAVLFVLHCPQLEPAQALAAEYLLPFPLNPIMPLLGMWANFVLVGTLDYNGLAIFAGYTALAIGVYAIYGYKNSKITHRRLSSDDEIGYTKVNSDIHSISTNGVEEG